MTEPPSASILANTGVAAVILAAGASTRFGSSKQLARIGEGTMLEAVIGIAREAGLQPILAVVPSGLELPADVVAVRNDEPQRGMSRSLQLGLRAVPPGVGGAVVLLGDQPTLPVASVRAIVAAQGTHPIVAASADGLLLPPVLIERSAFGVVDELSGDIGLREIVRGHPHLVRSVSLDLVPHDVDTPADLELL
jgi:CTP:molybdopterin cytidylyltransferase MocA